MVIFIQRLIITTIYLVPYLKVYRYKKHFKFYDVLVKISNFLNSCRNQIISLKPYSIVYKLQTQCHRGLKM